MPLNELNRAFKTARFSKDAKKAKIKDVQLCLAIQQVLLGQVDDLGSGFFRKRLNDNLHPRVRQFSTSESVHPQWNQSLSNDI